MGNYLPGQVCLNGHVITGDARSEFATAFCQDCGEKTISSCDGCKVSIRGDYDEYYSASFDKPPSFCPECGKPYPWTERRLTAAKELVDEIDGLDADTARKAKDSFALVISDTPQTALAAVRIKKMLSQAGSTVGGALRDILVDPGGLRLAPIVDGADRRGGRERSG